MNTQEQLKQLWTGYNFKPNQIDQIKQRVNDELLEDPVSKNLSEQNMMLAPTAKCAGMLVKAFEAMQVGHIVSTQDLFDQLRTESVFRPTATPDENLNRIDGAIVGLSSKDKKSLTSFRAWVTNTLRPAFHKLLKQLYREEDLIANKLVEVSQEYVKEARVKKLTKKK